MKVKGAMDLDQFIIETEYRICRYGGHLHKALYIDRNNRVVHFLNWAPLLKVKYDIKELKI